MKVLEEVVVRLSLEGPHSLLPLLISRLHFSDGYVVLLLCPVFQHLDVGVRL